MVTQNVRVGIISGLHFRPASRLAEIALEYHSTITMKKDNTEANIKSFFSVFATGVKFGDEIQVICDGEDENEALKRIVTYFENGE